MADENKDAIERTYGWVESQLMGDEVPDPAAFAKFLEQSFQTLNENRKKQDDEQLRQCAKSIMAHWSKELNRYIVEVPSGPSGANLYTIAPFKPVSSLKVDRAEPLEESVPDKKPRWPLVIDRQIGKQSEKLDLNGRGPNGWDCHIEVNIPKKEGGEVIHTIEMLNGQITKWERVGEKVPVTLYFEEAVG